MLGQFGDPSELDGLGINKFDEKLIYSDDIESDDLNGMLKSIFKETSIPTDPSDFILREKLDERESLLMDGDHCVVILLACADIAKSARSTSAYGL